LNPKKALWKKIGKPGLSRRPVQSGEDWRVSEFPDFLLKPQNTPPLAAGMNATETAGRIQRGVQPLVVKGGV
jgi:hypothetical protein